MTTIHTRQLQQYKQDNLKLATIHTIQIRILQHAQKEKTPKQIVLFRVSCVLVLILLLSRLQSHSAATRIMSMENSHDSRRIRGGHMDKGAIEQEGFSFNRISYRAYRTSAVDSS